MTGTPLLQLPALIALMKNRRSKSPSPLLSASFTKMQDQVEGSRPDIRATASPPNPLAAKSTLWIVSA